MTDTPPTKRRFWQVHLSTALLVMMTASGFMWLNLSPRQERVLFYLGRSHDDTIRGWPFYCLVTVKNSDYAFNTFKLNRKFIDSFDIAPRASFGWECWWLGPLANALVAFGSIICIAGISEAIIRRNSRLASVHRATLFFLMLLTAALLGAQVYARHQELKMGPKEVMVVIERGWPGIFYADTGFFEGFHWDMLVIDVVVCVALLAVGGVGVEWVARRIRQKATT